MDLKRISEALNERSDKSEAAKWVLFEAQNLKSFFREEGVCLDDTLIPVEDGEVKPTMYDTIENLVSTALTLLGYDKGDPETFEVFDFIDQYVSISRSNQSWAIGMPRERLITSQVDPKYKVGDTYVCWAGAPGIGKWVYQITRIDQNGIHGFEVMDSVRTLEPWEAE